MKNLQLEKTTFLTIRAIYPEIYSKIAIGEGISHTRYQRSSLFECRALNESIYAVGQLSLLVFFMA
jgi:hypothetical protein